MKLREFKKLAQRNILHDRIFWSLVLNSVEFVYVIGENIKTFSITDRQMEMWGEVEVNGGDFLWRFKSEVLRVIAKETLIKPSKIKKLLKIKN